MKKNKDGIFGLFGFERDEDAIKKNIIRRGSVDVPLLMVFSVLLVFGIVTVFSASYAYAYSKEANSFGFITKQLLFDAVSVAVAATIVLFYDRLMNRGIIPILVFLYFCAVAVLLVLVLFIGTKEGEAQRWINIGGITSIQPSEFMKGAMIMFLAWYYSRIEKRYAETEGHSVFLGTILPCLMMCPVFFLVFLEHHTSGVIILGLITIMMVFFGERRHWLLGVIFAVIIVLAVVGIAYLISLDPEEDNGFFDKIIDSYAWKRIDMWLRPEKYDLRNDLWQSVQGIYAIGSGGFMGVGLGQSRQKHLFVSQPQNDFIFTILCEEMGFVGGVAVIFLFGFLIWRGMTVGSRIPDTFSRLTVWGLTASIGMQAFMNIAVVTGVFPNTGISLPFFSYGGSSILSLMIEVGVILALSRYAEKK